MDLSDGQLELGKVKNAVVLEASDEAVLTAIDSHVSNTSSLTRRERISYLWQLSQLCLPEEKKDEVRKKMSRIPYSDVRCECGYLLDERNFCPDCTRHYERVIYSDAIVTKDLHEEILDACIPENLKLEHLWMYFKQEESAAARV